MQNLIRRRVQLKSRINGLSPISVLPTEVLTYIFRLAITKEAAFVRGKTTPLLLGGVCNKWRSIAWSTPLLWNKLTLRVSSKSSCWRPDLLHYWLLRAGTSPLYISVDAEHETESTLSIIKDIVIVLMTRSEYWRSVDFLLPRSCHDMLKDVPLPIIKRVVLRPPMCTISAFNNPPPMFTAAPELREVELFRYEVFATFLPWVQLQHFKSQSMTIRNFLQLLQVSSNLEICEIDNIYFSDVPYPSSPLSHQSLRRLNVGIGKRKALVFLDHVAFPALRDLKVSYYDGDEDSDSFTQTVASLIRRSKCDLYSLDISKYFAGDNLIPILQAIPSLRHLCLGTWLTRKNSGQQAVRALTADLLRRLTPDYDSLGSLLLPNLKSLVYQGIIPDDCQYPLVDFLRSRSKSITRLLSIKLLQDQCCSHLREQLHQLLADGIRVEYFVSVPQLTDFY